MKAVQIPPNAVYKCVLLFPGFEGRVGCIPRGPGFIANLRLKKFLGKNGGRLKQNF